MTTPLDMPSVIRTEVRRHKLLNDFREHIADARCAFDIGDPGTGKARVRDAQSVLEEIEALPLSRPINLSSENDNSKGAPP